MSEMMECRGCTGAAHDLFSCLLQEQRVQLAKAALSHAYQPHETVFHAETYAHDVFCVRSGTVKLLRSLPNGDQLVVGVRGAGDLIGLRNLLQGIPHVITAQTIDSAVVCAIPGEFFLELIREHPMMGYKLLERFARSSQMLEDQLVERTHDPVCKRAARFLLQRAMSLRTDSSSPTQPDLVMSREEMAQLIGTTPETLSRTLHGFAIDGVLAVDRKQIRVLDVSGLERLAQ